MNKLIWIFIFLGAMTPSTIFAQIPVNYDESLMPSFTLPNPLVLDNGETIKSAKEWEKVGRPAVLQLFSDHVQGRNPLSAKVKIQAEVRKINNEALGGKAISKQIRLSFPTISATHFLDVLLYIPKNASAPSPVFIGLNFDGNHTTTTEKDVFLTASWTSSKTDNYRATEATRGSSRKRWPLDEIIAHGYAVATAHYCDLEADHEEGWKTGLRSLLTPAQRDAWSGIGVWAWSMSRMLDYLIENEPLTAAKSKAIAIGHSRLGKAALWAAAQDTRFAMIVSNNSGEGGAALSRRWYGETVEHLNTRFPHWFCAKYKNYSKNVAAMPVDYHELLGLMAPRPLYVASATKDQWADPKGEFLSALEAQPVYALYQKTGLGTSVFPAPNTPIGQTIGYHIREGAHDILLYDWQQYMNFADKHLK